LTGDAGKEKPALMAGFFVSGVWWNRALSHLLIFACCPLIDERDYPSLLAFFSKNTDLLSNFIKR
jgi:hypothetical protein